MPEINSEYTKKIVRVDGQEGDDYLEAQQWWPYKLPSYLRRLRRFARTPPEKPGSGKSYPLCRQVHLNPQVALLDKKSLLSGLMQRKSTRNAGGTETSLNLNELATLMTGIYGKKQALDPNFADASRVVPSPGGFYSPELYFWAISVEGLEPGVYHFQSDSNSLEMLPHIGKPIVPSEIFPGETDKNLTSEAAGILFFNSRFARLKQKYGDPWLRLACLEVGCICQNLELLASVMRIGILHQGLFDEGLIRRLLMIDGKTEACLHTAIIFGNEKND